ncbi:MAG: MG2 domain-containing protein, partial [Anaerolineales bacterium]
MGRREHLWLQLWLYDCTEVVNVDRVAVQTGRVSLEEFVNQQQVGLYSDQTFVPADVQTSTTQLDTTPNRSQVVSIPLNAGDSLAPGLYWLSLEPQPMPQYSQTTITYAVVTHVQMVFKIGPTDALVWAIDRRTNNPVVDTRVRIVTASGTVVADGRTDGSGVFQADLTLPDEDVNATLYSALGEPGGEYFSLAKSDWSQGIAAWDFDYTGGFQPPHMQYYLYTDRPIYRPGQTVDFRLIGRQAFNGRYQLPDVAEVSLVVEDDRGQQVEKHRVSLDAYGSGSGSYILPESASPGYYRMYVEDSAYSSGVNFQVAEYRKPEIDLSINVAQDQITAGSSLSGEVAADYFFDAPVAGVSVDWNVYARDSAFSLPGYAVGPADIFVPTYLDYVGGGLGEWQTGGTGTTGVDGRFSFTLPTESSNRTKTYT